MSLKIYAYDSGWAGACLVAAHSREEAIKKFTARGLLASTNTRGDVKDRIEEFEFNENFTYENLGDL